MEIQNKIIAIVASGWHFPHAFYARMAAQQVPDGWGIDLFCIAHRDPSHAAEEKQFDVFPTGTRGALDSILYDSIATKEEIESLGWDYKEYPNTIGDWGNSNQWLETHEPEKYDLFLFTHDDNLILNDQLIKDIVEDDGFDEWDILGNSAGMPHGSIRGSFEFFKPEVLRKMGWRFDLSEVSLTREGETSATNELEELYDWNATVYPLTRFVRDNGLKFQSLSPCYRVSAYCVEGERGYIHKTHGINTAEEDAGLAMLERNGLI